MRKKHLLSILMAVFLVTAPFMYATAKDADKEKHIDEFKAGRVLTSTDIEFLNTVTEGKGSDATINGKKYTAGQKLSSADITEINKVTTPYKSTHTVKGKNEKPLGNAKCTCTWGWWYVSGGGYMYYCKWNMY